MAKIIETENTLKELVDERSHLRQIRDKYVKLSQYKNSEFWPDLRATMQLNAKNSGVRILNVLHDDTLDDHQKIAKQNYHKGFQDACEGIIASVEDEKLLDGVSEKIEAIDQRIARLKTMKESGEL